MPEIFASEAPPRCARRAPRGGQAARLDPRSPLVLDTRELGRRPGSLRRARVTAPAPSLLGTDMLGVPVGADLDLDLRLEAVMDGVLVSGEVRAPLAGECGRCLEPVETEVRVDIQELYAYEGTEGLEDDDPRLDGDYLDLEPAVRDAVVLALPLTPLCGPDCAGLCPRCGARLDDVGPLHQHDTVDPRWSALRGLTAQA